MKSPARSLFLKLGLLALLLGVNATLSAKTPREDVCWRCMWCDGGGGGDRFPCCIEWPVNQQNILVSDDCIEESWGCLVGEQCL